MAPGGPRLRNAIRAQRLIILRNLKKVSVGELNHPAIVTALCAACRRAFGSSAGDSILLDVMCSPGSL